MRQDGAETTLAANDFFQGCFTQLTAQFFNLSSELSDLLLGKRAQGGHFLSREAVSRQRFVGFRQKKFAKVGLVDSAFQNSAKDWGKHPIDLLSLDSTTVGRTTSGHLL